MIVPQIESLHVHSLRFDQVYKFESLVVFLLNKVIRLSFQETTLGVEASFKLSNSNLSPRPRGIKQKE